MNSSRRSFLGTMTASVTSLAARGSADGRSAVTKAAAETNRPRIHANSDEPPKLRTVYSLWSLMGLPRGGQEWTMEQKFRRAKEAGFEGIEIMSVGPKDEDRVRRLLDKTGLFL